jgi:hypothetical protein
MAGFPWDSGDRGSTTRSGASEDGIRVAAACGWISGRSTPTGPDSEKDRSGWSEWVARARAEPSCWRRRAAHCGAPSRLPAAAGPGPPPLLLSLRAGPQMDGPLPRLVTAGGSSAEAAAGSLAGAAGRVRSRWGGLACIYIFTLCAACDLCTFGAVTVR